MTLVHIAIFQETTGETTCPGRVDQFLNPYYEQDLADGVIHPGGGQGTSLALSVKLWKRFPYGLKLPANAGRYDQLGSHYHRRSGS
ncbi:MAG: hypothetical protein IPF65_13600 [Polaromonas sp.]|nr:hypothetical protein [Polaromonas sp.]